MPGKAYRRIIRLILQAAELAKSAGISNLLQPGLVKEMIIAEILGHELIISKRDADAHAPGNPQVKYEYLSCKEGGSGQIDRMFRDPPEKRATSLDRIRRNALVYFAVFRKDNQLSCKAIYELDTEVLAAEAERQLDASRNQISHLSFSVRWAERHGRLVYKNTRD